MIKEHTTKQYSERNAMALDKAGGYYSRHVQAMTAERLDSKSDIAAELGWRDMQLAEAESLIKRLVAENIKIRETLEDVICPDNVPEYHSLGMGCGIEDRGLQANGYAACEYGWDKAIERVYSEVIPDSIPETPATDEAMLAAAPDLTVINSEGKNICCAEKHAQELENELFSAKAKLLAYEQAAKNPVASCWIKGGMLQRDQFIRYDVSNFPDGEIKLFAAPVLPKQSDGALTNEGTNKC